jgi:hypothetical protein
MREEARKLLGVTLPRSVCLTLGQPVAEDSFVRDVPSGLGYHCQWAERLRSSTSLNCGVRANDIPEQDE